MAVRYDASARHPGQAADPLQSVDPWRSQAGDPGPQVNLDARATAATAENPWRSYVPLSSAYTTFQAGAGQHGCFVTRTQPVPGGGSMAFSGTIPPGFQGAGSHGTTSTRRGDSPWCSGCGITGTTSWSCSPWLSGRGDHGMVAFLVVSHVVAVYKVDFNMALVEYQYTEELCP